MEPNKGDHGNKINESHRSTQKAGVKGVQEDKPSSKQKSAGDKWDSEGDDKKETGTNSNNSVGIKKEQKGKTKG